MLIQRLDKRRALGNLRRLSTTKGLIDFASNDYLGLSRSPLLFDTIWEESKKLERLGSTGSRLLTGNSSYIEALEERIADFHGYEEGLIFGCGYMANIGLLAALGDASFIYDAEVHASIRSGIRLSRSPAYPFRHNDLAHLEERLKKNKQSFICVESIYSTDGSFAPLSEICCLAKKYRSSLIVDEAHAVGVLGPEGRGLVAQANLQKEVFAQVVTFGKALGVYGAVVLGSPALKEALINFAPSCIYTTALPFYALAAIKSSYDLFPKLEKERAHLLSLASSHIQSLPVSGNYVARGKEKMLQEKGFDVRALLSPTVQRGKERLRLTLHSFNTKKQLKELLQYL